MRRRLRRERYLQAAADALAEIDRINGPVVVKPTDSPRKGVVVALTRNAAQGARLVDSTLGSAGRKLSSGMP